MRPVLVAVSLLLLVAPAFAAAPSASTDATKPGTAVEMARKPSESGLTEVQIDLDGDSKADLTNYVRERPGSSDLVLRKDIDLNRDGKIDVRTTFDDAGLRVEETLDQDFDGKADWVDHYISGKRSYAEVDTNFDGSFDLFKYYEGGLVRRKERDADGDGKIDFWEYLDEKGAVLKTGRDVDGDGKMDVRE